MKKILVSLLALMMLCSCTAALAEESATITLDVTPVSTPDDAFVQALGLTAPEGTETLPVVLVRTKKATKLAVTVLPKNTKNKKVDVTVDNEDVVKVKGTTLQPIQAGQTVMTVTSKADPSVSQKYRVIVFQPVTRLTVTAPEKSVAAGKTLSLTPVFTPEDAQLKTVSWASSNEGIATVDANGTVTGVKKGNVRITATANDGSGVRANISLKVTQGAEEIQLNTTELTVDAGGKGAVLKATVLPKNTDNKKVSWTSSDETIATVNAQGRVTGLALGDCEITCTSQENGEVQAKATVHVQQPVTKVTFGEVPTVYTGETAQLTWTTEPANASNPALTFKSANEKILTVDANGVVTGIKAGKANVTAVTQDGSNRRAKIQIKVLQHVTGVHMKHKTAYIDLKSFSTASAVLEPKDASNLNMTWEVDDPSIATVKPARNSSRVNITGVSKGETTVHGTTEDGGFKTSILVKVGNYYDALSIIDAQYDADLNLYIRVKNVSDNIPVTSVTAKIEMYDNNHNPVPVNSKSFGSNTVEAVYRQPLDPGHSTQENKWKIKDYSPNSATFYMDVTITDFQIDGDWIKAIPENRQKMFEYYPNLKK